MFGSLRIRFLVFTLGMTVLIAATIGGCLYFLASNYLRQIQDDQLISLARFTASEYDQELAIRANFLKEISHSPVILDYPQTHRTLALKKFLEESTTVFERIRLEELDSASSVSWPTEVHRQQPDSLVRRAALADPGTVYWEIRSAKQGEAQADFVFYLALQSYYGSNLWGLLKAEIPIAKLSEHIIDLKSATGNIYLAHLTEGVLPILEENARTLDRESLGHALSAHFPAAGGEPVRVHSVVDDHQQFMLAETKLAGMDWLVVAAISHQDYFAPIFHLRWSLGGLTALFLAMFSLGAYWIGARLGRPLALLAEGARDVADGHLSELAESSTLGEIRDLIAAFNHMVRNLRETTVSRDYIESILRSMREALVVVGMDGRITTVNPAACRLFGYDGEELIGQPINLLFSESDDGRDDWLKTLTHSAGPLEEKVLRQKDGRHIPVIFSWARFNDQHGRTQGLVCLAQPSGSKQHPPVNMSGRSLKNLARGKRGAPEESSSGSANASE